MNVTLEIGTAIGLVVTLIGAYWGMAKLMFVQFEKRQDANFAVLTAQLADQAADLEGHMKKQDAAMLEIKRVESIGLAEVRRVETKLTECQLDALQRFQTKAEATDQHKQILDAITGIGNRIDQIIRAQDKS
jgi:hypothetical protein